MITMKKTTRLMAIIMAAIMSVSVMLTPAFAASNEAQEVAEKLYSANLFLGYGTDANGNPIFGLDDTATRGQAITMLVRMLGKTDEAIANASKYNTPFTDVPTWCKGAVGYAYQNGLTAGTSATTFSPNSVVTNTEYLVFVLRALGYQSGTDYVWEKAANKAAALGIIDSGEYTNRSTTFTRGDMVIITYGALMTKVKDSTMTLAEKLGISFDSNNSTGGNSNIDSAVTEINMNDINNGYWLDTDSGTKEINISSLPEGSIINYTGFSYSSSKSTTDNLKNFVDIINTLDSNVTYDYTSHKFDESGRKHVYVNYENGGWIISVNPTWGCNFSNGESNYAPTTDRTLALNAMSYFGDESMAKAVYALMMYHYFDRADNDKIISSTIAAKYGLTINHTKTYSTSKKTAIATVSNGSETWEIAYHTSNDLLASSFAVVIK